MSRKLSLGAAALLTVVLAGCGDDIAIEPVDGPSAARSAAADVSPPTGFRWVGVGHAAIAVLESWPTNKIHCGTTPTTDTVIVDVDAVNACASARGKNLESIQVLAGERRFDFEGDLSLTVDGVPAERTRTACTTKTMGNVETCTGSVYIPSEGVQFLAESSTGANEVDAMLARIRMLPQQVAVPGRSGYYEHSVERYVADLEAAGFRTRTRTELRRGMEDGHVLAVDPAPGTMLRPGDFVTVTASGGKTGPADEILVGMNWHDEKGQYDGPTLDDQQVRDGATITLGVGWSVWAYGSGGELSDSLAGSADGDVLERRTQEPNLGRSWVAVKPGRALVTLYITDNGKRYEIGTVTVVVQPAR